MRRGPDGRQGAKSDRGDRVPPMLRRLTALTVLLPILTACGSKHDAASKPETAKKPSLLLVTLDTTRADAIGPETTALATPAFTALARRGLRFTNAYATAPQTLPSHASMLTGLYPAGHGVHENSRRLRDDVPTIAERLKAAGYRTEAFVSGYPLDRQFGLARGFDRYDDELGDGLAERDAFATTARALGALKGGEESRPLFLWVHYYDPHEPYAPPEPFRSRFVDDPYLGEIAAMDEQLGRLVAAFETKFPDGAGRILVVGDHGEALGDHGETFHGNLLYQGVMRVPLVLAGEGIEPGVRDEPVSIRRVADTLAAWAGLDAANGLATRIDETVLAEAMQPYLLYGWQPQVMAIHEVTKAIRAGGLEVYDLRADPKEEHDLGEGAGLDRELRQALRDYPLPSTEPAKGGAQLDEEAQRRLASLGYLAAGAPPKLRADAPAPREMTRLFARLDRGSGLFVRGEYAAAIPLFEELAREDPGNLTVALRLAVACSVTGRKAEAERWFGRAAAIEPDSIDLAHYRAMHELRNGEIEEAGRGFEKVLAAMPERLPALEGLAAVRVRQQRLPEAIALLGRATALERDPLPTLLRQGDLAMAIGDTATALAAFERARDLQGAAFSHQLELGVLYLDQKRLAEAAAELDQVPDGHPGKAMALFKRAQVAVLLGEPDAAERIAAARAGADAGTARLIAGERLFAPYGR